MVRSGTQAKIEKIERIQDKIVRTIAYKWKSDAREDIDILRVKYNIESLITRRKRSLLKIMYKQSLDEINIDNYRPDRILCSRNKVKLKSSFTRITKIQRSQFYRGVRLWNELPLDLQRERNIEKFKRAIKIYDFGN